jgi:HK97 family phage portal protein
MAVISSEGRLTSLETVWAPTYTTGSVTLFNDYVTDYATIFRTQPAVRTVVSFLARNIAQLALKVYRRLSDVDREHLPDHELAAVLKRPSAYTTHYRLLSELVHDLAIFDAAYWAKVVRDERMTLQRLPPGRVRIVGESWIRPEGFEVVGNRRSLVLDPSQVVYFRGYDPSDLRVGVSPMETIRQILAEEHAAGRYREQYWRSGARISGWIGRPLEAGEWSDAARQRFQADWTSTWAGEGPGAGGTPILEDGMEWKPATHSARDSQYLESRKLTREEVASMYHVAPTMVGILEDATYSNIQEQHRHLYADTIAPWLTMIEEDVELQLLHAPGDFSDTEGVYVEFNLEEKLKGSFEEQAASLQTAVGAPWMTRNEGRARLNLPSLGPDGDGLVTPLNVLVGGQASPTDSAPPPKQSPRLVPSQATRQGPLRDLRRCTTRAGDAPAPDRERAAPGASLWRVPRLLPAGDTPGYIVDRWPRGADPLGPSDPRPPQPGGVPPDR